MSGVNADVMAPTAPTKAPARKASKGKTTKAKGANAMPPAAGKQDKALSLHFRTFDLPGGRGDVIEPRENSKRGMLYAQLNAGKKLTLLQIQEIGKENGGEIWKPRDAMDALRLLSRVNKVKLHCDPKTNKWEMVKR